ncbi:MAG TPA: tetratricopeptide repeat protein [Pyrinomonadaceae bacterium]|nr:tetratricopeptide repeat protein [Pyrinomonadaceae bacterium]
MLLGKKILSKLRTRSAEESVVGEDTAYELGLELARQGRHDEAVSQFNRALQTGDNLAETYLALGLSYEQLGRGEKAIKSYSEAIRIKADLTEGYRNLGLAYDRSGQFLNAIRMHMKAIRLRPNDVELRKNLGFAYFNVGSYPEAIKAYKQALELNPQDPAIHYNLGLVYLDLEDWEGAVQCQKAITELGETAMATNLTDEIDRQVLRSRRGVSKNSNGVPPETGLVRAEQNGFTVIELMIVLTIISVLSGFALLQITRARQAMIRENAARQFAGYLEKARLDSLRRHPATSGQMAQVSIINATFYTVTIDANGDGALDAPTVVSLVPDGLQLNGPFPRTIYFNWRGRTVDASGNVASPSFVTISNTLTSRIDLTTEGQPSLSGAPVGSAVNNSAAPTPNFRPVTQFP